MEKISRLNRYVLDADDGEIGRCVDFLFDEQDWTIRYMVADTGKWLPGRRVLISPISLKEPDYARNRLPVDLTKEAIEDAPPLEADQPVSRQFEARLLKHYGLPHYWGGSGIWGPHPVPAMLVAQPPADTPPEEPPDSDNTLRSVQEVTGYRIAATDGDIGHVEDFLLDETAWVLRYLMIDTRNWLPGRKVIIHPNWISEMDWMGRTVSVSLTRKKIEDAPEYNPKETISSDYEKKIHEHYRFPLYWQ